MCPKILAEEIDVPVTVMLQILGHLINPQPGEHGTGGAASPQNYWGSK